MLAAADTERHGDRDVYVALLALAAWHPCFPEKCATKLALPRHDAAEILRHQFLMSLG